MFVGLFQSVAQKSEKIGEEEAKCQHMADLAQHDLDEALPALEEAMKVSRKIMIFLFTDRRYVMPWIFIRYAKKLLQVF